MYYYKKNRVITKKSQIISKICLNFTQKEIERLYEDKHPTQSNYMMILNILLILTSIVGFILFFSIINNHNYLNHNAVTPIKKLPVPFPFYIIFINILLFAMELLIILILLIIQILQRLNKLTKSKLRLKIILCILYMTMFLQLISFKFFIDFDNFFNPDNIEDGISISYEINLIQIIMSVITYLSCEYLGFKIYSFMNLTLMLISFGFLHSLDYYFLKFEFVNISIYITLSITSYLIEFYFKKLFYYQIEFEKAYEDVNSTLNSIQSGIIEFDHNNIFKYNSFMKTSLQFLFTENKKISFNQNLSSIDNSIKKKFTKDMKDLKDVKETKEGKKRKENCELEVNDNEENIINNYHITNLHLNKDLFKNIEINDDLNFEIKEILQSDPSLNDFLFKTFKLDNLNKYFLLGVKKFNDIEGKEGKESVFLEIYYRIKMNVEQEKPVFVLILNDISKTLLLQNIKTEINLKTTFLAKATHELKNPTIVINELSKECIEYLNTNLLEKLKSNLKVIDNYCYYIISLVSDFDFISKKENNIKLEINSSQFDLFEVFEFISNFVNIQLKKYKKSNSINFYIENNGNNNLLLTTDRMRFIQLIFNLISNAIKFTDNGSISIKLKINEENDDVILNTKDAKLTVLDIIQKENKLVGNAEDESQIHKKDNTFSIINEKYQSNSDSKKNLEKVLEISISDTGIGISNEYQQKMFIKSFKNNTSSNYYGSGYGLLIIKDLIDLMNFRISYTSNTPKGSIFTIKIPFKYVQVSHDSKKYIFNEFINEEKSNNINDNIYYNINHINQIGSYHTDTNNNFSNDFKSNNTSNTEDTNKVEVFNIEQMNLTFLDSPKRNSVKKEKTIVEKDFLFEVVEISNMVSSVNNNVLIYNIILVDDDQFLRKSSIRVIESYVKSCKDDLRLRVYQADDGIELLYMVYKLKLDNVRINFILTDQSMMFLNGIESSRLLDVFMKKGIIENIDLYILSAYDKEFLNEDIKNISIIKGVLSKPLSNLDMKRMLMKIEK